MWEFGRADKNVEIHCLAISVNGQALNFEDLASDMTICARLKQVRSNIRNT